MMKRISLSLGIFFACVLSEASVDPGPLQPPIIRSPLRAENKPLPRILKEPPKEQRSVYSSVDHAPHFDLPITYNNKVKTWIQFFQGAGRRDFRRWLERSHRYFPKITPTLDQMGLPRDLAYVAMIESGFSAQAVSTASAVGYWQFIAPTAQRYGLQVNWWLDERRDFVKSTLAAANYLNDLYKMFGSWYLAAAGYNMGENRVKRLIKKYQTNNYWILSKKPDFPVETEQYIPKLLAAMVIAKAPELYGFKDLQRLEPYSYDFAEVPGGTDLENLAKYIGADKQELKRLNPELIKGFIPPFVESHKIKIPKGYRAKTNAFVRASL
jgi:membrane-bound lytic murein transglycosylase D